MRSSSSSGHTEADEHTRVVHEIWSMMIHILRTPPLPSPLSLSSPWYSSHRPQISPAAFGALFIGISASLMLFGIVTFVIGFVLMPMVIMLVLLFYFAGLISKLSEIGRAIICPASSSNYKVAAVPVGN